MNCLEAERRDYLGLPMLTMFHALLLSLALIVTDADEGIVVLKNNQALNIKLQGTVVLNTAPAWL
jgi:hypothetical protein